MKISKLLTAIAVFSFLVAPALSAYAERSCSSSCTCISGSGCGSHAMNCSSNSSKYSYDSRTSKGCACFSLPPTPTSIEVYDPGYSYLSKGSSRPYGRESPSFSSSKASAYFGDLQVDPGGIGPPDLDVIEYLPPSAQLVFSVLASDGPLTQKDLISKTELPPRTVRYALNRLKEESVIKECFYFPDARQSLYGINGQGYEMSAL
ncbi:MAG TPA: winged helix-turn-helix domain-containing protein [Methanotrichaceae archaeon]|nr:winged helix-turn-helix domain-containing protein [Methanotrichaceae archaeon]